MASLMPVAKQQYFYPGTALPLVGGKIYTYAAGTSTPQVTYQDAAGTVPNTNPITLDSSGSALIYWSGSYKIVVQDALGNTVYTVDNYTALETTLSGSGGAAGVGFLQSGIGAVLQSVQDKLRKAVHLTDFFPAGFDTVNSDCRTYIQAALDSSASGILIRGAGKAYRITGSIYIRGDRKALDFEGGQLILDTALNNQQAVVIDNPTTTPTAYQGLKNVVIVASAATQATTSSTGVAISGGVLHPCLENVYIQNFGRTSGNGTGMTISGGPLGGTDTPYYGEYRNLKIQLCANGLSVGANLAYPNITTHFFHGLVVGGCTNIGVSLVNAQSCTFTGISLEQNGGANLSLDHCKDNYFYGGLVEGGSPNISVTNQDPNFSNVMLVNVYPVEPAGTGTRVGTYYNNPLIGMEGNILLIERTQGIQVIFNTADVMQLKFAGIVTIQTNLNTYARFYLYNNTVEIIETAGVTGKWSTTKNNASTMNIYYDGAASPSGYYVQNSTGGGVSVRFFTEVGF